MKVLSSPILNTWFFLCFIFTQNLTSHLLLIDSLHWLFGALWRILCSVIIWMSTMSQNRDPQCNYMFASSSWLPIIYLQFYLQRTSFWVIFLGLFNKIISFMEFPSFKIAKGWFVVKHLKIRKNLRKGKWRKFRSKCCSNTKWINKIHLRKYEQISFTEYPM